MTGGWQRRAKFRVISGHAAGTMRVRMLTPDDSRFGTFSLETTQLDAHAVCVEVEGEFDLERAYDFDRKLRAIEDDGVRTLVLDLRGVRFLDSAGLARIIAADRRAAREGRRFAIVRGCRAVERLFALTAISRQLEMVSDPRAALEGAGT
jgi:anti-anti-sigma factor